MGRSDDPGPHASTRKVTLGSRLDVAWISETHQQSFRPHWYNKHIIIVALRLVSMSLGVTICGSESARLGLTKECEILGENTFFTDSMFEGGGDSLR